MQNWIFTLFTEIMFNFKIQLRRNSQMCSSTLCHACLICRSVANSRRWGCTTAGRPGTRGRGFESPCWMTGSSWTTRTWRKTTWVRSGTVHSSSTLNNGVTRRSIPDVDILNVKLNSPGSAIETRQKRDVERVFLLICILHMLYFNTPEGNFWKSVARSHWSMKSKMAAMKQVCFYNTGYRRAS